MMAPKSHSHWFLIPSQLQQVHRNVEDMVNVLVFRAPPPLICSSGVHMEVLSKYF